MWDLQSTLATEDSRASASTWARGTACTPATPAATVRVASCGTNPTSTRRSVSGFGKGVSLATTYTAYTSPNNSYSTVKEVMFKLSVDDSAYLGKRAVKPYVILAQEFSAEADGLTNGQADGGGNAGTYLEIGAAPGYAWPKASLTVPVKVGLSLSDYYELNTGTAAAPIYVDHKFGYFSIAGLVTVPLGGTTGFGAWNLHGGVEYQALGDTTEAFNGGDSSRVIGSIGIGFSY
jgi:hypothetical protein